MATLTSPIFPHQNMMPWRAVGGARHEVDDSFEGPDHVNWPKLREDVYLGSDAIFPFGEKDENAGYFFLVDRASPRGINGKGFWDDDRSSSVL